jgi:hypothetical protein
MRQRVAVHVALDPRYNRLTSGGARVIRIGVDEARPGMTLARPVLNEAGIAIYGEGIMLTEPVIQRIASMHIGTICVEGRKPPVRPLEEELEALHRRFSHTETFPHMSVLKRIVREHIESLHEHAQ